MQKFAFFTFSICAFVDIAAAQPAVRAPLPDPEIIVADEQKFADALAARSNLKPSDIMAMLAKAKYQQSVIDTMTRPAEAKPWKDYRPIFVNDRRINDGIAFYRENRELLERVETTFGVPAPIVVAILGVETNYGHTPTRYRVLDALTTLAFYYPPRAEFFKSELAQLFLLHSDSFPYEIDNLMGSYAGAMGWGQFMPSSIAQFARDGDGDGKIDLWNSLPDVCQSVANYFVAHGWEKDGPVALPATVAENARKIEPSGLAPVYPLQQLQEWGYSVSDKKLDPMRPATLLEVEGANGPEYWIVFENFYVISRYNKSPLYSLAAFQLSQAIGAAASGQ
ncbi:MAG TPA: lytic murein transglycosylase B [Rudaea sp.]|jgi:membrane-bound lytic murein transglycosylase B|nr:lytic murein transglycosylase B [Rudaea sp.]